MRIFTFQGKRYFFKKIVIVTMKNDTWQGMTALLKTKKIRNQRTKLRRK
jgi:hypothetical protein